MAWSFSLAVDIILMCSSNCLDSDSTEVRVVRGADTRPGGASDPIEVTSGGPRLTVETGRNNAITGMSCS